MKRLSAAEHDGVTSRRRELKFLFRNADPGKIARVLEHNATPIRFGAGPTSSVSSIYFDDHGLASCVESLAGVSRRVKLRVRWYDTDMAQDYLFFELKRRDGRVSAKERVRLELGQRLETIRYRELVGELARRIEDHQASWLGLRGEPSMLVSYQRRHFRQDETGARITLDWGLRGYDQLGARRPNRDWPVESDGRVIVEVKVPVGDEERVSGLLHPLRVRLARSSKYVHCCTRAGWPQLAGALD